MKKIIHIVFGIIIALTIIGPIIGLAIIENDADMDNITKALGAGFLFVFAGILLVVECGLYYNSIYFFTKKNKRVWKTVYNLVMLTISCTMIVSTYGMQFWDFLLWETMLVVLAISSIVLWFVYAVLCVWKMTDD